MPALIFFDIDKTLTSSKQPLTPEMAALLTQLLERTNVAIISGGAFAQFREQIINQLPQSACFERLYILPTSGAALYTYQNGAWKPVYEEHLTDAQAVKIRAAIETAIQETGVIDLGTPSFGDRIEFRGAQVTLSALGQQAPIAEKEGWDPDASKKRILRDAIAPMLPEFDVKTGGSTSIDVTLQGVNKAYGVRKVSEIGSFLISDMLYIGDALYVGGNDEVVKETGIRTHQVSDPDDTMRVIQELLSR
ncbi:MAG: phosphomannomutase [Parcubacteria bacterium C7867-007]|nr:MAG: phosphomannomutase [Parcubacteria bacterium C7867-007]